MKAGAMAPQSYLFVPADRPERYPKALASGADAVIVDLEDAVAPAAKAEAREALAVWLAGRGGPEADGTPLLVRINAAGTPWFEADLARLRAAPPGAVQALMLPKAERVSALEEARRASGGLALVPLIETAEGFDQLDPIARAPGVQRLAFGSIDFQLDMGIEESDSGLELLPFRAQLVLASRLAQLAPPIDGVTPAIDDAERLGRETLAARRLGSGAKLCIHRSRWPPCMPPSCPARPSSTGRGACSRPCSRPAAPRWRWTARWSTGRWRCARANSSNGHSAAELEVAPPIAGAGLISIRRFGSPCDSVTAPLTDFQWPPRRRVPTVPASPLAELQA
jgi:citrate lyase subunit beta / citryl-CoA lyase